MEERVASLEHRIRILEKIICSLSQKICICFECGNDSEQKCDSCCKPLCINCRKTFTSRWEQLSFNLCSDCESRAGTIEYEKPFSRFMKDR